MFWGVRYTCVHYNLAQRIHAKRRSYRLDGMQNKPFGIPSVYISITIMIGIVYRHHDFYMYIYEYINTNNHKYKYKQLYIYIYIYTNMYAHIDTHIQTRTLRRSDTRKLTYTHIDT